MDNAFSFTAPFPTLKQRRVSLGLPPTTPRVPWSFRDDTSIAGPSNLPRSDSDDDEQRGKMRKTEAPDAVPVPEKKPRKKWSAEETQMLVDGCNTHGVGNWKTILSDPSLKFDNRSPVDLKDRFRTYFPDAYKKHYPNARTHLSSKVRSTLPDGSSLFEKTRSKRRRPFTEEEDHALKAGYEKHGTVWATIVKDPVFQEQNRRSTDLRDRFRNAFPELYQAAGYKPRNNASKKKKDLLIEGSRMPQRAATDDQLALSTTSSTTGPVRGVRRRRAQTSQGILLRGGTKSVPQSTACSEYEDSSGQEDDEGEMSSGITTNAPKTPVKASSTAAARSTKNNGLGLDLLSSADPFPTIIDDDDEMEMRLISLDPLEESLADYPSTRRSGVDTPTHSHHPWSSPRIGPNNINDGGGGGGGGHSGINSSSTSTSSAHPSSGAKIGQSAWGTQDWLSPNPRLDHSFTGIISTNANNNGSSTPGTGTPSSYFSPSSPFHSFNLTPLNATHPLTPATNPNSLAGGLTTLNMPMNYVGNSYYPSHQHHGVIERYDLWPPSSSALASSSSFSAINTVNSSSGWSGLSGPGTSGPGSISGFSSSFGGDISSEVSFGDAHSAFSDEGVFDGPGETYHHHGGMGDGIGGGTGSFRVITHHSDYAGDLIFGARGYGGGGFGWFGGAYTPAAGPTAANEGGHASESGGGLGLVGIGNPKDQRKRDGEVDDGGGSVGGDGGMMNANEVDGGASGDGKPANGKGSINPMQLHAPSGSLSGIDETRLAGITLNDTQDVDVDGDDAMEGTGTQTNASAGEGGLGLNLTGLPSPLQRQRESRGSSQQVQRLGNRNRASLPPSSTLTAGAASPGGRRRFSAASRSGTVPPLSLGHDLHAHSHSHGLGGPGTGHSHHHSHSLGLNSAVFNQGGTKSEHHHHLPSSSTSLPIGRFSLDDLDLVDLGPDMNMNNLTPPATPMMQHAQQLRGMRRYSVFGLGLGSGGGGGGGSSVGGPTMGAFGHTFGQAQGLGQVQNQGQGQGQGGRSISVPPSEARNSLGMSFVPMASAGAGGTTGAGAGQEGAERGRSGMSGNGGANASVESTGAGANEDVVITAASGGVTVKRSLSSTVHHSHGPGHGHSLSMSTLPPFPPHSEIWRSRTPTAKGSGRNGSSPSSSGGGGSGSGNVAVGNGSTGSGGAGAGGSGVASLLNMMTPPTIFSPSPSLPSGANGGEFTNPDLPFLDLHYWHQNQQGQATGQGHGHGHGGSGGFGAMMVDSTEEARQALDLAEPFLSNGHGHWQGFGAGFANAAANPTTGGGLKSVVGGGGGGILPLSLTRQVSAFATRQNVGGQGQGGHQRGQSQQVVNPKDLVLNVGVGGVATGRTDNKRKRASWDGGVV